jgi:hypothetical protein
VTLRADLTALLTEAGLTADLDAAVADEHVRWALYRRVVAALAARKHRDDRKIVATIVRDPVDLVAKSAVVELVDAVAATTTDPAAFQAWAAEFDPELDHLSEGQRAFVRQRVRDWTLCLTIETGHAPTAAELNGATSWLQRLLADHSTSREALSLLAETGRTRKIRNIARHR